MNSSRTSQASPADLLRAHGLKATPQRLAVLQALMGCCDHPSAETLHRRVTAQMPTVSLDTVYRSLAQFEDCDLARKVMVVDGHARYDGDARPHHHAVCRRCGCVDDLDWPDADRLALPEAAAAWGRVNDWSVRMEGLCARCAGEVSH